MLDFFRKLLATDFMPHGFCIRDPGIIQLHVVSDIVIAVAYFLIPLALLYFVRKRRDLAYPWLFGLFSLFILSCGTTHILGAYVLWHPVYRLDGLVKAVTALASLPTALLLIRILPNALQLSSPDQLRAQNLHLEREIGDRQRAEEEILRLNHELEQRVATRTAELQVSNVELKRANEDLSQFAWAASHDLQEPLRIVSLFSQLVQQTESHRLSEDGKQHLQTAAESAERMQVLIADLLTYVEVTGKSELAPAANADEAFDAALVNLSSAIAETGASVTRTPLPDTAAINPSSFVLLFQNLLSNALKYRQDQLPPQISVSAELQGSEWAFAVKDNGIGIAPEYQNYIFGIFKRLHTNEISGTGLGLALCQRIVERHGGRIWVESQGEGHGSTFHFTLPVAV